MGICIHEWEDLVLCATMIMYVARGLQRRPSERKHIHETYTHSILHMCRDFKTGHWTWDMTGKMDVASANAVRYLLWCRAECCFGAAAAGLVRRWRRRRDVCDGVYVWWLFACRTLYFDVVDVNEMLHTQRARCVVWWHTKCGVKANCVSDSWKGKIERVEK